MSNYRQDPITGTWVIIAPVREQRPRPVPAESHAPPNHDPNCPFCPGNERLTPPELFAYRLDGSQPDAPGWSVRIFPNKFPAVRLDAKEPPTPESIAFAARAAESAAAAQRDAGPLRVEQPAVGQHEVLVESPAHDMTLAQQSDRQMGLILDALRSRYRIVSQARDVRYVSIFKNQGTAAGASIEHGHLQLLATSVVPPTVMQTVDRLEKYEKENGRSMWDVMLEEELSLGRRVVAANDEFVALTPWASAAAYEMWLVPRDKVAFYGDLSDTALPLLGTLLRDCLTRLQARLGATPYNLIFESGPRLLRGADHARFHLRIVPRLAQLAGFELGTGVFINTVPPEEAADSLRTA